MGHKPLYCTRRDFLKLSSLGFLGFITNPILDGLKVPLFSQNNDLINEYGRVIYNLVAVYEHPSFTGKIKKQYWKDAVIPITEVTIGDDEPNYNRIWYGVGNEGFAHSGGIQPVKTIINIPESNIPKGGQLAEVTVPYTDAIWEINNVENVAYRFYYETTHWVVGHIQSPDGTNWYRVIDDKWELILYVQARHLRLIPRGELSVLSPDVPPEAKRLEVRTKEQIVIAYELDNPVFMARTATGAEFSNGKFYTPTGRHKTFHKRPSRHMAAGNLAANGFDLPGIPWVSYITKSGVAFHGTYWHNDYGRPRSHGCINLPSQAAKWIYRWTLPIVVPNEQFAYDEVATIVDVY
jgi:hypothetical protein